MRDQGVGRLEDADRRAVVLFELDHLEVRVVARQSAQIGDIGAAPAIDCLIVIADGGERGARAGQEPEQLVLADIGILVFIDQQIAQAVLPFIADGRLAFEERHGNRDQIVKVDRLVRLQSRRITVESIGGESLAVVLCILPRLVR